MRSGLSPRAVSNRALILSLFLVVAAGFAEGQERLEPFERPASQTARDINALYDLILPISIVIGVLVEAFLLYAILRYRAKPGKVEVTQEHERGHTALEVAWTIPPAVILLVVGLLSAETLSAIETPPQVDFEIKVIAFQWGWRFEYPDGSTSADEVTFEEDRWVRFRVVSLDVVHSWAIPALGVKIDAIPGRVNFYAVRADQPGEYRAQCMEYCGLLHYAMVASVVVFPNGTEPKPWRGAGEGPAANLSEADRVVDVDLVEGGGTGGQPWSAQPSRLQADANETLGIRVRSPEANNAPHNLTVIDARGEKVAAYEPTFPPGGQGAIVHKFGPGEYTYYCAVPGHRELGMEGTLMVI